MLPDEIGEAHRPLLHRVHQPHAVDELALVRADRLVEARQVLRRDGEVGIQNHQDVAGRHGEAGAHGITLPAPGLAQELRVALRVGGDRCLDGGVGVVGGMSLDEDELRARAHLRRAGEDGRDVSRLVARGNNDRDPQRGRLRHAASASGRAMRKFVSARWRRPHSFTSTRLLSEARPGSGSGHSTSCHERITRKSVRCSRLVTSDTRQPVLPQHRRRQAQLLAAVSGASHSRL